MKAFEFLYIKRKQFPCSIHSTSLTVVQCNKWRWHFYILARKYFLNCIKMNKFVLLLAVVFIANAVAMPQKVICNFIKYQLKELWLKFILQVSLAPMCKYKLGVLSSALLIRFYCSLHGRGLCCSKKFEQPTKFGSQQWQISDLSYSSRPFGRSATWFRWFARFDKLWFNSAAS